MFRAVVACVLLLAAPLSLAAEGRSELEPPDLEQFLRWGPLRVRPGMRVTNFGYDDNVFYTNDSVEPQGDYTITLVPRVDGLVLLGSRAFLTFSQGIGYTAYREFSNQNYFANYTKARVMLPLRSFGLFSDFTFNSDRTRPVDEEDIRPKRNETGLSFGALFELGWRTDVELMTQLTDWRYTDEDGVDSGISRRLDRDVDLTRLTVGYQLKGRTRATLELEHRNITFNERLLLQDAVARTALGGFQFGRGGALTGRIRAGWTQIDADDPLKTDFSGVTGDMELTLRVAEGTRLQLTGERTPGFSITVGSIYYVNQNYGLRVIRYFNRLLGAEAAYLRGNLTFPGAVGPNEDREDDYRIAEIGLRFRIARDALGRTTEYKLTLQNYVRQSTNPNQDRSRTTLYTGATFGF